MSQPALPSPPAHSKAADVEANPGAPKQADRKVPKVANASKEKSVKRRGWAQHKKEQKQKKSADKNPEMPKTQSGKPVLNPKSYDYF